MVQACCIAGPAPEGLLEVIATASTVDVLVLLELVLLVFDFLVVVVVVLLVVVVLVRDVPKIASTRSSHEDPTQPPKGQAAPSLAIPTLEPPTMSWPAPVV